MSLQQAIQVFLGEIKKYQTSNQEELDTCRQTLVKAFQEVEIALQNSTDESQLPDEVYQSVLEMNDEFFLSTGLQLLGGFLNFFLISGGIDQQNIRIFEKILSTCSPLDIISNLNQYSLKLFKENQHDQQNNQKEDQDGNQKNKPENIAFLNEEKCDILRLQILCLYQKSLLNLKPLHIEQCMENEFYGILECLKYKANESNIKIWQSSEFKELLNTYVLVLEKAENRNKVKYQLAQQLLIILEKVYTEFHSGKAEQLRDILKLVIESLSSLKLSLFTLLLNQKKETSPGLIAFISNLDFALNQNTLPSVWNWTYKIQLLIPLINTVLPNPIVIPVLENVLEDVPLYQLKDLNFPFKKIRGDSVTFGKKLMDLIGGFEDENLRKQTMILGCKYIQLFTDHIRFRYYEKLIEEYPFEEARSVLLEWVKGEVGRSQPGQSFQNCKRLYKLVKSNVLSIDISTVSGLNLYQLCLTKEPINKWFQQKKEKFRLKHLSQLLRNIDMRLAEKIPKKERKKCLQIADLCSKIEQS